MVVINARRYKALRYKHPLLYDSSSVLKKKRNVLSGMRYITNSLYPVCVKSG